MVLEKNTVDFFVNHIILPPKLPHERESEDEEVKREAHLLRFVVQTMTWFCNNGGAAKTAWQSARSALINWEHCSLGSEVRKEALIERILKLEKLGPIMVHLKAANTALFIRKSPNDQVIFEAFEVSPESKSVIQTEGRLVRTFPGRSVIVPRKALDDKSFCEELATMIHRLHKEHVPLMIQGHKGNENPMDDRNSNPGLVTEMLLSIFSAHGDDFEAPQIKKHIRDEVNWSGGRLPWRRSPLWLAIRVCVNLALRDVENRARHWKNFMILLVSNLSVAAKDHIDPDVKAIINRKLARRLAKLSRVPPGGFKHVMEVAEGAISTSHQELQSSWLQFQQKGKKGGLFDKLQPLAQECDTELHLSNSRPYLVNVIENNCARAGPATFTPINPVSLDFSDNGIPRLNEHLDDQDQIYVLDDFENWVFKNLSLWRQGRATSEKDCETVAAVMKIHIELARRLYVENSMANSIMLLAVIECWRNLDLMCVGLIPMLGDYSPEIVLSTLRPLLLPQKYHMEILFRCEEHLRKRHQATKNSVGIFQAPHSDSFAVKYFDQSPIHKVLRKEIERESRCRKDQKVKEWQDKSKQYEDLVNEAQKLSHEHKLWNAAARRGCKSCTLENKAKKIQIEVDELSLPEDPIQLKTAVFELNCPRVFAAWRDTTWTILQDLGREDWVSGKRVQMQLMEYKNLKDKVSNKGQRITLASAAKSSLSSHKRKFPVDIEAVWRYNPLQYCLIDGFKNGRVTKQSQAPSFHHLCVSKLPGGPYEASGLQAFVDETSNTPNDAIANQDQCAMGISRHEFVAFGSLRAGELIQWHNIIRELGSAELTFGAEAVHVLIRQAAFQAGSNNHTALRATHQVFEDEAFCLQLLSLLSDHVEAVQSNWKEQNRLSTLIILGLRVLSLAKIPAVVDRAAKLLRRLRKVALSWCRQMTSQMPSCSNEGSAKQLREAILKSTLASHMAFNVDPEKISKILENQDDVSDILESSIEIHKNRPNKTDDLPREIRHGLLLSRKLSRRLLGHLKALLANSTEGVNQALFHTFRLNDFDGEWRCASGAEASWISNMTSGNSQRQKQRLDYDFLTGDLLIDGQPLGRLPPEFAEEPLYQRVFGSRILTVGASDLPQMQYRSLDPISGHTIHLALQNDELLIKADTGMQLLHVIPDEVFQGDLPSHFRQDWIHFLDMENRTVELRPISDPWSQPSTTMTIHFNPDGPSSMRVGNDDLIEMNSALGKRLSAIFATLEKPSYMVATAAQFPKGQINVDLPRFGLKFFVNQDGLLECPQLSSTVSEDQDIGCLYGLRNQLVLQTGSNKSVLIPRGRAKVKSIKDQKHVTIARGNGDKIRFVHYYQNTVLGSLQGTSTTTDILFMAYIFALTSSYCSDPLTQQTGTAEALRILSDQRLKTSFPLSEEDIRLLTDIAALTPQRDLVCSSSREQHQVVTWNRQMDQLSQSEAFFALALDITSHNARFAMLSSNQEPRKELTRGDSSLLKRAYLRNARAQIPSLSAELCKENFDRPYTPRDQQTDSPRSLRVYDIASSILKWSSRNEVMEDLVERVQTWKLVTGYRMALEESMEITLDSILNLQIETRWGNLYDLCRVCDKGKDRYKLMFLFAPMVFESPDSEPFVRTLIGIACCGLFNDIRPDHSSYELSRGIGLNHEMLSTEIEKCCGKFMDKPDETPESRQDRFVKYSQEKQRQTAHVVRHFEQQWPCEVPSLPDASRLQLIDIRALGKSCKILFAEWYKNHLYISHIKQTLPRLVKPTVDEFRQVYPSLMALMSSRPPPTRIQLPEPYIAKRSERQMEITPNHEELREILTDLRIEGDETRTVYLNGLTSSLDAWEKTTTMDLPDEISESLDDLFKHREELSEFVQKCHTKISDALRPELGPEKLACVAGLWPRTTVYSLLACLSAKRFHAISPEWKSVLTILGEAVSLLQRSERLIRLKSKNSVLAFYKEAEEAGRKGWTSLEYPSWLLMEIEGDFQIRRIQATVAKQMIAPDGNEVLQLNMGEGKTSVITPMILLALADGKQLARLVVLKPLLQQTNSLLSHRIGGLVDRAVYHLPFSRSTKLDEDRVSSLRKIFAECMDRQGVILALPEHIFSFRLMGRETLSKHQALALSEISLDEWQKQNCRDVLDESDELLDSRHQLVYSIGHQQNLDAHSQRWSLIIEVFSHLGRFSEEKARGFKKVEVDYQEGRCFPFLTFLDHQACREFLSMLVSDIFRTNSTLITAEELDSMDSAAAENFAKQRKLRPVDLEFVKECFKDTPAWPMLHLLRGLFAHGIIEFAIQEKQWLVHYGPALDRCLTAVPYRAKGVPSANSHFSHPDVQICLTCLSYYWGGLTEDQLRHAFEILVSEVDPSEEYKRWVDDAPNLPTELSCLEGVNLDANDVWESSIYPNWRCSDAAVNFYLTRAVFPREAKEYTQKLSVSPWDSPSEDSKMPTVGFSGTTDTLLPTSIKQRILPELEHTAAMVLSLLLKSENRAYIEAKNEQGRRLDLDGLLRTISGQDEKPQVLIDVGAQVLEAGNEDVARRWLTHSGFEAAVFFNEADEVMVVDRDSCVERLAASSFKNRLDHCAIYLDEFHTRGIDLDLPSEARAVVTLGPSTTKDRLIQGCMRLRKLGYGQSLAFLAPPQVHRAICAVSKKSDKTKLDSNDVVRWALVQTCKARDNLKPLYIAQGLEFCYRRRAFSKFQQNMKVLPQEEAISTFVEEISEPDARTLEHMYGEEANKNIVRPCLIDETAQQDPMAQPLIEQWDPAKFELNPDAMVEEEQEREVSHEVEQQRDTQAAPAAEAFSHDLHEDVISFIETGTWEESEDSPFHPALEGLEFTSAYKDLVIDDTRQSIFVTDDFMQTVDQDDEKIDDDFLRPVKWIVSSVKSSNLVIISAYEANELLEEFKASKVALAVCDFLGMVVRKDKKCSKGKRGAASVPMGGFADPEARASMNWPVESPFVESPLPFLRALIGIRRKGQTYVQTPVGKLANGHVLTAKDFGK
ncbi:hypothetical protein IWZ01DRAFT_565077 [Phyllosticta capitalensis]